DDEDAWPRLKRVATSATDYRRPAGAYNRWRAICWRRIFQDDGLRTEGRHDVAHVNVPPVGAQCQALNPFRAVNRAVGPFVRHFRMQIRVSYNTFLNLRLGLSGKWIGHYWEVLRACRRKLAQCRRMERLAIAAAQGESADVLRINRLPANRNLWLL